VYLAQGDPARAIEEARLAQPLGDSAPLRWVLADALVASARPIEAAAELEGLIGKFAADSLAVRAYARRLQMSDAEPDLTLTTEGRLSLARLLLARPESGALAWMTAMSDSSALAADLRVRAGLAAADYFYRAKRYGEAESLLIRLRNLAGGVERDRATFLLARVYRNTGRPEPMEPLYRELMRAGGALAADAAWDLAREYESLGRWSHARAAHGILIDRYPDDAHHRDALFRRGFTEVRLGMLPEAAEHFRDAFTESREAADLEQAAFWLARTLDALGRPADARDAARAGAVRREPADYYGVRLRERYELSSEGPPPPEKIPLAPDVSWESAAAGADWPEPVREAFLRGIDLARLGVLDAARREWQRAADLARDMPFVFETLAVAAAVHHVYPEGVRWANRAQSLLPYGFPTRAGYDRLAAPAAYYGAVSRAASAAVVEPELVWAIMRQESLYDPLAVSRADARGLLQILPATLIRIDREEGRGGPRSVDDLFRPEVNIPLGVRFFADRRREFAGHLLPALAAYNAGEGKVRQWIARAGGDVDELFVESIGYPETHEYVRRIVWLAWVYRTYYPGSESSLAPGRIAR
jgi:soluble lytic murein transglycosylase